MTPKNSEVDRPDNVNGHDAEGDDLGIAYVPGLVEPGDLEGQLRPASGGQY